MISKRLERHSKARRREQDWISHCIEDKII